MNSFWQDVRYSLRMIAKAPGYAAIAVLTLALGIGANTTIFSWINSTLLNPIPGLASPNEVVALTLGRGDADNPFPFTYPDFESMRDGQQSFVGTHRREHRSHEPDGKRQARARVGNGDVSELFRSAGRAARSWGAVFCRRRTRSRAARPWP